MPQAGAGDQPCDTCPVGAEARHDGTGCRCPLEHYNASHGTIFCAEVDISYSQVDERLATQACPRCPPCADCSREGRVAISRGYSLSPLARPALHNHVPGSPHV